MFLTADPDSRNSLIGSGSMHRLFFALYPPAEVAVSLAALRRRLSLEHRLAGPRVPCERLHVSLNHVGSARVLPQHLSTRAQTAASTVRLRPFVVQFDRVVSFQNNVGLRPLVLLSDDGVIGVLRLYSAIHAALAGAGVGPRHEPKREPHLTLLRDAKAVPETFIEPIRWTVEEFVLIDSPFREGRHDVLGRFPLID